MLLLRHDLDPSLRATLDRVERRRSLRLLTRPMLRTHPVRDPGHALAPACEAECDGVREAAGRHAGERDPSTAARAEDR